MPLLLAPILGLLARCSNGSYMYCTVRNSGMQGHQWDHAPAAHHFAGANAAAAARADCDGWEDCAGYYMHPNKVDYYSMPRVPGPHTTWPGDTRGCESAQGGIAYIRQDAVCVTDFRGCGCNCVCAAGNHNATCKPFTTVQKNCNTTCDHPPPPPPPLSTNPCLRFGMTIPVSNHIGEPQQLSMVIFCPVL
jgi:hypothetical protein